jgi:hypothetical protein
MIGLNFNENNKSVFKHYKPEKVDENFDMLVEKLPEKDETKSDMIAKLHRDINNTLYWEYKERPKTEKDRIVELENTIADLIGGN